MLKDKHIISGINVFFHKNDCNKATNSIMTTIRHLNLRSSYIGIEKRPNCKLTCLQVLELLLIFPFSAPSRLQREGLSISIAMRLNAKIFTQ